MKIVRKNIEIRIYPTKVDFNDNGEKIVSINKIESNIGINRFIYNKELEFINYFKDLLIQNGYDDKVKVNDSSCNVILIMLIQEYPFLEKAESSSRQQAQRDLIQAFKRYHDPNIKSNYPVLKTKKKSKKHSFRIINNNNNIRITKDKNGYDKIKLAKLGIVKFKTSKEYHELLWKGSDPNDESVKIKHVTVKKVHGIYYAKETNNIIRYQKNMSHHKPNSTRYLKAQELYNKSWEKLLNKRKDYYNKVASYIVKNSSFIAVQNENIISWKNNKHLSHAIQLNAPRQLLEKIEQKCQQENVEFVKVSKFFPSTQICHKCQKRNETIKGLKNLEIRDWDCPICHTHHDRDRNAAINILNKGLEIVGKFN